MINNLVGGLVYLPLWKMMEWVTVGMMKFPIWLESHIKFHGSKPPSSIQWIGFVVFFTGKPHMYHGNIFLISGSDFYQSIEVFWFSQSRNGDLRDLPSCKQTVCYWKWQLIADIPINSLVIFHSYVNVYQRVAQFFARVRIDGRSDWLSKNGTWGI